MSRWNMLAVALSFPGLISAEQTAQQFDVNRYGDATFALTDTAYGTNVGIVMGESGVLLIDPMPGEASVDDLHEWIKGISQAPVRHVANTHDHEDHTGGNGYFRSHGATIIGLNDATPQPHSDNERAHLHQSYGLKVIVVESHTNHDVMYFHAEANVLFVGDVFDNNWHPTFYAGGLEGFTRSIDMILATGDEHTVIVPGHGAPANKAVVKAFHDNTLAWIGRVSELHEADRTVEQMLADQQINDLLQRFNTGQREAFIPPNAFRRFIERTVSIVSSD